MFYQSLIMKPKTSKPPVADDLLDDAVPAEDVLMPDIYADEHSATVPDLKIFDSSSPEFEESAGFDPYDTCVLHKK